MAQEIPPNVALFVQGKIINKVLGDALEAHKHTSNPFFMKKHGHPTIIVFAFPGTWSVGDWFSTGQGGAGKFGEININSSLDVFPSIRTIGNSEFASVNDAFLRRFSSILEELREKVKGAMKRKRQIIFTGHSGGGPIAIYATVWLLEHLKNGGETKTQVPLPLCLTFGSPLIADGIFGHALRREN
ncbi:hypothetical protein SAY87_027086 [Trapa incisa]|uniref:Fungal lipase-type domain-containing protein n=1 Tax=Trapa incisa TaxID=236973 RepID=A0AAN7H4E4_9MYRT|nr:hypothetical protein SAY87_027086 [Trapa incisa]